MQVVGLFLDSPDNPYAVAIMSGPRRVSNAIPMYVLHLWNHQGLFGTFFYDRLCVWCLAASDSRGLA